MAEMKQYLVSVIMPTYNCGRYIREAVESVKHQQVEWELIIIDDASHWWSHQIKALYHLFPSLKRGGIYILEDLGTSFEPYKFSNFDDANITTYDFLSAISECVCSSNSLQMDNLNPNLVVFINEIEIIAEQIEMMCFIH